MNTDNPIPKTSTTEPDIIMPTDEEIRSSFRRPTFAELDKLPLYMSAISTVGILLFLNFSLPLALLVGAVSSCALAVFVKNISTVSSWQIQTIKTPEQKETTVVTATHPELLYLANTKVNSSAKADVCEVRPKKTLSL